MIQKILSGVFWDRRAVTSVLSNILLMIVAVAAMSLATTAAYLISNNFHGAIGERLIIEDVWFKNNDEISVYLRNIGKADLEISAVYVNNTSTSFTELELGIGDGGWVNITQTWAQGSIYHINIVTRRGTQVGGYYTAS
jgi:hypothetical protein